MALATGSGTRNINFVRFIKLFARIENPGYENTKSHIRACVRSRPQHGVYGRMQRGVVVMIL